LQKPHPPIIVGGGFPQGARRAVPTPTAGCRSAAVAAIRLAMLPPFRELLKVAGRPESEVPVTLFGVGMNGEGLKRARDAGVDRFVFGIPAESQRTRSCRCSTKAAARCATHDHRLPRPCLRALDRRLRTSDARCP